MLLLQIGALDDLGDALGSQMCVSGVEFDELVPAEQSQAVSRMALFSRVEPSHKTQLVELLRVQVLALNQYFQLSRCTLGLLQLQ